MILTALNRKTDNRPGTLGIMVLAVLAAGELHGRQIRQVLADRSGQRIQASYGTLYPLLKTMAQKGWLSRRNVRGLDISEFDR